jgi:hypothetical protein
VVAFDGKTSRGSKRNKTDRDAVKAMHTGKSVFHRLRTEPIEKIFKLLNADALRSLLLPRPR